MGGQGPTPKRSDQRRRRNSPTPDKISATTTTVEQPAPDESWPVQVKDWYCSLADSAQAAFYEPSDWRQAHLASDVLAVYYRTRSPAHLREFRLLAAGLMVTESDRRRGHVEVDRRAGTPGQDVGARAVADVKARLGLVKP